MNLEESAISHGTDKYEHGYCPHYERHFAELREGIVDLLEIGVYTGASLCTWAEYFYNSHSIIDGVDIDPQCANLTFTDPRMHVIVEDVNTFVPLFMYDIIIDDGSHLSNDIVSAFTRLWPSVNAGGFYVIEDWLVQWAPEYQGDVVHGSSATSMAHTLLDLLLKESEAGEISELHAYPQILFLRRKV